MEKQENSLLTASSRILSSDMSSVITINEGTRFFLGGSHGALHDVTLHGGILWWGSGVGGGCSRASV